MWYAPLVFRIPLWGFPGGSDGKAYNAGDLGSIPGLGRSPGEGNGNPFEYSCLGKFHGWRSLAGYSPWGHRVEHDWATSLHFSWGLSDFVFFSTLKKIFFPSVLKRACFTFKIRRKVTARRRNVILMHHLFKLLTSGFMFSFIFKNNLLMIPPSFRAGIYWWY